MSQTVINVIVILALGTVAVILFMGLWNMFKGNNPNRSQTLMRARVIAQAVAVVVLLAALFLMGRNAG